MLLEKLKGPFRVSGGKTGRVAGWSEGCEEGLEVLPGDEDPGHSGGVGSDHALKEGDREAVPGEGPV